MFREWAPGAPDEITAALNLTTAPPLPVVPEEWHGKKVIALIAVSAGPIEEAEAQFRAFREVAEPVADLLGPMPYTAMQTLIDPLWQKGIQAYFKATNLAGLDDELIERLCEHHIARPGPQCEIHVHQMGGAVGACRRGRHGVPRALDAVRAERGHRLARPGGHGGAHGVGAGCDRCGRRGLDRTRLRQLPRRLRRRAVVVRS